MTLPNPAGPAPSGGRLEASAPADAPRGNWVDRHAPLWMRPFLRLARADRPIGSWLLVIPCLWSVAMAAFMTANGASATGWSLQAVLLLALFSIGSVAMRGAGCTWNDILDRDIDGMVERTRSRPLPSGQVGLKAAFTFLALQCLAGLLVLVCLPPFAILVALSSMGVVVIYPLMKRVIWIPQLVLGLAFSWGALMGFAALLETLPASAFLLYAGSVVWVVGYDTIYAHQDREDDAIVGVKSSARLFERSTKPWLVLFYALAVALIGLAIADAGGGIFAWLGLALFAGHLAWQVVRLDIDDPARCLVVFLSNRDAGLILFAGFALQAALN